MRIYSDYLTEGTLISVGRHVVPTLDVQIDQYIERPKLRMFGWYIRLWNHRLWNHQSRRHHNTGNRGAGDQGAASYDDHGRWFSELYKLDPLMVVVATQRYESADDFNSKTGNKFAG